MTAPGSGPPAADPADDARRHRPADDADPWWHERWAFDVWSPDGTFGATTCLVLLPGRSVACYWSALVRPGERLLAVWDTGAPPPRQGLTLRADGLWAEHVCEAPLAQWTVANECHGVLLDDPEDALGRGLGDQAAMAFDLEWYGTGPVDAPDVPASGGWSIAGEAHGVIELGGGGSLPVDGLPARYRRSWGAWPYALPEAAGDGAPPPGPAAPVRLLGPAGDVALRRVLTPTGWWERVGRLPG